MIFYILITFGFCFMPHVLGYFCGWKGCWWTMWTFTRFRWFFDRLSSSSSQCQVLICHLETSVLMRHARVQSIWQIFSLYICMNMYNLH